MNVAEKELDLLKLTASLMTEARAGSLVMWGSVAEIAVPARLLFNPNVLLKGKAQLRAIPFD